MTDTTLHLGANRRSAVSGTAFSSAVLGRAIASAFAKLDPRKLAGNPVILTTEVVAVLATVSAVVALQTGTYPWFAVQIALWLWATVLFANFAESIAEGRGKAAADALRAQRVDVKAKLIVDPERGTLVPTPAYKLEVGEVVLVEAGDMIPADGEIVEGVASVNEAAITGESAPVIPLLSARSTMERPSGVSSAREAIMAACSAASGLTPGAAITSVAMRAPKVMVPVLSSSRVSASPDASTARPEVASTLNLSSRSMPAMPMADSRPPMVVGMRQTKRAPRTRGSSLTPEYWPRPSNVPTAIRKIRVRPARSTARAISLGVLRRSAPSTMAIMRSRKVEPWAAVILTTI